LSLAGLASASFRDYEFADYHRAFARGAGICTQFAAAVFDILKRQGFDRGEALFEHHTVTEARTRVGKPFLLDADNGVVMPRSLAEVRANPAIVRPYYLAADRATTSHPEWSPEQGAREAERAFGGRLYSIQRGNSTP